MAKKTHRMTALLTESDDRMLTQLCTLDNESKGAVLRVAIRSSYAMRVLHKPTCATGQPCLVPHVHPQLVAMPPVFMPPAPAAYEPVVQ